MNRNEIMSLLKQEFNSKNTTKTICLWGRTGMGATQTIQDVAHDEGFNFKIFRMSQIQNEHDMEIYINQSIVSQASKTILVFDELSRATSRGLVAAYEVMFNRSINGHKLENLYVLASDIPSTYEGSDQELLRGNVAFKHIDMSWPPELDLLHKQRLNLSENDNSGSMLTKYSKEEILNFMKDYKGNIQLFDAKNPPKLSSNSYFLVLTDEQNETLSCWCGAKHNKSNPNYHQDYCPLYKNK